MINKKQKEEWLKKYNANLPLDRHILAVELDEYLRQEKRKSLPDIKNVIDWKDKGGMDKAPTRKRRSYDYFTHLSTLVFYSAIPNRNLISEHLITLMGDEEKQVHVYITRTPSKCHYFKAETLVREFLEQVIPREATPATFVNLESFISRYGPIVSTDDSATYLKRLKIQQLLVRRLLEIRSSLSSEEKFLKLLSMPEISGSNFDKWDNSIGWLLRKIPPEYLVSYPTRRIIHTRVPRSTYRKTEKLEDHYPYAINLIYKYVFDDAGVWSVCEYCRKLFKKQQKNINCCSPAHSKLVRNQRSRKKTS